MVSLGEDFLDFLEGPNPISIGVTGLTIDSGLTTYPSIQRRDFGLRDNWFIKKGSWVV